MPARKTSTSKSLDNFLSDSDGKKVTKSPARPRKTAQSKSKKQTPKKTTTTPKAKAKSSKTSTKGTTSTSKRSVKKVTSTPQKRTVRGTAKKTSSDSIKKTATTKRVTKKPVVKKPAQTKKPVAKKPTKRKPRNPEPFHWTKSRTKKLFPWVETFPVALEDHKENKKCWFVCLEHAEKYVVRYKMYKQDYKCIVYYKSDVAK